MVAKTCLPGPDLAAKTGPTCLLPGLLTAAKSGPTLPRTTYEYKSLVPCINPLMFRFQNCEYIPYLYQCTDHRVAIHVHVEHAYTVNKEMAKVCQSLGWLSVYPTCVAITLKHIVEDLGVIGN